MNFEFSDDQKLLKEQARGFLQSKSSSKDVRRILDGNEPVHPELWKGVAEMGWLGASIPEEYGGLGLGYLELCVIAEELGADAALFGPETTAEDIDGWDSISHASVIMAVERAFSIRFDDEEIYGFANVGALYDRVRVLTAG